MTDIKVEEYSDWIKVKELRGSKQIKYITITNKLQGEVDFITWLKKQLI